MPNVTQMYNIKDGQCYQYPVADKYVQIAETQGAKTGLCHDHGYSVEGHKYHKIGYYGKHRYQLDITEFSMAGL